MGSTAPQKGPMEMTSQHTLLNLKTKLVLFLWLKISFLWEHHRIHVSDLFFNHRKSGATAGKEEGDPLFTSVCNHVTQPMLPLNGSSQLKSQFHWCLHSSPGYVCL